MSTNSTIQTPEGDSRNPLLYGIFQTCQLISVPVYLFLIRHLVFTKTLRAELAHHVILVILLVNLVQVLIDQSLLLNYLRQGVVTPSTPSLCLLWLFVDAYTYDTGIMLMAWASMERHILIFHRHWLLMKRERFLIHYLPLLALLSYTFAFFVYAMLFFPCENFFDYTMAYCGYACYYSSTVIVAYESLAHESIPIILIAVFSIALVLRVVLQRRSLHQGGNWRKHRKMTIQLVSISTLYFVTNFPYTINPICTLVFNVTPINGQIQAILLNFVSVIMPIILPFACLGLIPHLKRRICWTNEHRRRIQPLVTRATALRMDTRV